MSQHKFKNPIVEQRADPWVYKHTDGYYYFTGSIPAFDCIELRRSQNLYDLQDATPVIVWRKHETGAQSTLIWAPEIHFIDGKWYIYYAAATSGTHMSHRVYVLENDSANPLEGTWVEKGQVKLDWESFSLDATTFEHKGVRYLVWAQQDYKIAGNTNLYIAEMENPWTIKSPQVMITKPDLPWECIGYLVNEGPAVIKRNGRIFLTYSASATDRNYCMGLLTADESSNLLDPKSWVKSQKPVFTTDDENKVYGPGHNGFTVSPDGQDILVYHARNYEEIIGNPLADPNRHACMQVLTWNEDGTPNFGRPQAYFEY